MRENQPRKFIIQMNRIKHEDIHAWEWLNDIGKDPNGNENTPLVMNCGHFHMTRERTVTA